MTKDIIFLPEYFKNNGYYTMGKGKIFHGFAPEGVFDEAAGREKGFGPRPKKKFKWDKKGTSTDWGAFVFFRVDSGLFSGKLFDLLE